jgi:BirA family transcriptional regulator, biotin operon repressor / biotin---[acetyl-CoA-carboxylase] ligase
LRQQTVPRYDAGAEEMNIEFVSSIDSTNSELMRRAAAGDYSTVCLVAKEQTAGRGRLGRAWLSDAHSLMLSIGLPLSPLDWSGLSLVVGVSIAESLHPNIQIKWPNDLWVDGQKLAGILIETTAIKNAPTNERYTVIGVGINLEAPAAAFSQAALDAKAAPIGLCKLIPRITPEDTLERLLQPLMESIKNFEQYGWKPYATSFAKRDALQGRTIKLSSGMAGYYTGINEQGALLLQTDTGMQTVISHEVSVCL